MFVWNKPRPSDEEVVLRVYYSQVFLRVYAVFILLFMAAVYIAGTCAYVIPQGKYIRAIIILVAGSMGLALGLEFLFTKRIVFYKDRVIKEWHLLGERTIFYDNAKLVWASRLNGPRKGKGYIIRQVAPSGILGLLQVPIWLVSVCVSPKTEKQVDAVLSYLVGIDEHSTASEKRRLFVRTELPKEVL